MKMRRGWVAFCALVALAVGGVACTVPTGSPPVAIRLTNPDRVTVAAPDPSGVRVSITRWVEDPNNPNHLASCTRPPNDLFPIGETTVVCSANDFLGRVQSKSTTVVVSPPTGDKAVQVDLSNDTACAVYQLGTVRCWGYDSQVVNGRFEYSEYPTEVAGITTATQVAVLNDHMCALLADGTVSCRGMDNSVNLDGVVPDSLTPTPLPGFENVTELGDQCALIADGTVRCFKHIGLSGPGLLPLPYTAAGITDAVSISGTCAVLADGTAKCWGSNHYGEAGVGSTAAQIFAPLPVVGLSGVTEINQDQDLACARMADSTARCWGSGGLGALGNGTTTPAQRTPVVVTDLTGVTSIAAGYDVACAVLEDGTARCWGTNRFGQLGIGSQGAHSLLPGLDPGPFSTVPVPTAGVTNAVQASMSGGGGCLLMDDGTVRCWGMIPPLGGTPARVALAPVTISGLD